LQCIQVVKHRRKNQQQERKAKEVANLGGNRYYYSANHG